MATVINQTLSGSALVVRQVEREPITDVTKHSFVPYTLQFPAGGATFIFDFAQQAQNGLFDHPEGMFVDNSTNASPINVMVSITGQTFPVPAYSSGNYRIFAVKGSQVTMSSPGVASGNVSVIFTDFELSPVDYSAFNQTGANPRTIILGDDGQNAVGPSNPITVGGALAGVSYPFLVDNQGRLAVYGAAAGGSVYGNDATGNAPSQPPVFMAGLDSGGKVRPFALDTSGRFMENGNTAVGSAPAAGVNPKWFGGIGTDGYIHGLLTDTTGRLLENGNTAIGAAPAAGINPRFTGGIDTSGHVQALLLDTSGRMLANNYASVVASNANPAYATGAPNQLTLNPRGRLRVDKSSAVDNATLTNVAQATTSGGVQLLAANLARRGLIVVNDTTAGNLLLAYAANASATSYTWKLAPGATLELADNVYTGVITAIWDAGGSGAARTTELS